MSSHPLLLKLLKWSAVGVLLSFFSAVGFYLWAYHVFSIKVEPMCVNFEVTGALHSRVVFLAALQDVVESAGMPLKAEGDMSKTWQSTKASVTYVASRDPGSYFLFICQEQQNDKLWQSVAKRVEPLLHGSTAKASLQMAQQKCNCNPNCAIPLAMPIDFELVHKKFLACRPNS